MATRRALRGFCFAMCTATAVWCGIAKSAPPPSEPFPLDAAGQRRVLAEIDTVGRRGFLYEVTRPQEGADPDGRRLFLYGTIHIGRVGSEPFNPPLVAALDASCRLALEADPADQTTAGELTNRLGRYAEGDALQRHVSKALMERVAAYGTRHGMAVEQLARYRPWLLANLLTAQTFGRAGLDPALGSEFYLGGYARARAMPLVEIEGIAVQLHWLAELPDALQAAQLDEALAEIEHPDAADDDEALFDLWRRGDAEAANSLVAQMHREARGRTFGRWFVETLIDGRNRTMADRAEHEFGPRDATNAGPTFFAVGALHLFGERGLIAALRSRGYRVVDLQVDPARTDARPRARPACAEAVRQ